MPDYVFAIVMIGGVYVAWRLSLAILYIIVKTISRGWN